MLIYISISLNSQWQTTTQYLYEMMNQKINSYRLPVYENIVLLYFDLIVQLIELSNSNQCCWLPLGSQLTSL